MRRRDIDEKKEIWMRRRDIDEKNSYRRKRYMDERPEIARIGRRWKGETENIWKGRIHKDRTRTCSS
jgi:hypothetical protein